MVWCVSNCGQGVNFFWLVVCDWLILFKKKKIVPFFSHLITSRMKSIKVMLTNFYCRNNCCFSYTQHSDSGTHMCLNMFERDTVQHEQRWLREQENVWGKRPVFERIKQEIRHTNFSLFHLTFQSIGKNKHPHLNRTLCLPQLKRISFFLFFFSTVAVLLLRSAAANQQTSYRPLRWQQCSLRIVMVIGVIAVCLKYKALTLLLIVHFKGSYRSPRRQWKQ